MAHPLDRLKHHVTGAIERGEATAIQGIDAASAGTVRSRTRAASVYPDYETRKADCLAFIRKNYADAIQVMTIDGVQMHVWRNIDGHLFTFLCAQDCAADLALEMGVTAAELNAVTIEA